MKICITADIHVGVTGRLHDIMWSLRKIRSHCAENGIKKILVLGDLLHDREHIRSDDLNALVNFLIQTDEEYGIELISFPGNHDMYLKNSWDINSLKPLTRYLTTHHKVTKINIGGVRFWIIPFIHYEDKFMKTLDIVSKKHKEGDVLLTHIGVKSAILNTCFLLKSWSIVDFTNCPFDRVYTGHFHTHQKVGENVWFPGSPIPFKFDEGDVDHGFFIFDTETREHEFVSIWADAENFEDGKNIPPQFMTLTDEALDELGPEDIKNNIIRIDRSKEYTHNQSMELREKLHKLGARDVKFMSASSKESRESIELAKATAASTSELFDRFLEADKDGVKDLNKNILKKFNDEIIAEGDKRYVVESEFD